MKPETDGILLAVRDLKLYFPAGKRFLSRQKMGQVKAVDGISFEVRKGETLGLVGESGCGKTTLGLGILQLCRPTSGSVAFEGEELCKMSKKRLRGIRRKMQIIFQDPYSSLNPRMKVGTSIAEPLAIHRLARGRDREERVRRLLQQVGLNPFLAGRYPHEFSSGQRQRISIARALAVEPTFIICDEPVSALDVSIQAQILNLLLELQGKLGLTYLFISHDLSVVRHVSDRVAVMYLGHIVEIADSDELYQRPLHPYTRALLASVPIADPLVEAERERVILAGDVPSPVNPPPGCKFHPRCPAQSAVCCESNPALGNKGAGHWVACHNV